MTHRSCSSPQQAVPTKDVPRQGLPITWWHAGRRTAARRPRHRAVPARAAHPAHRRARRRTWARVLACVLCVGLVLAVAFLLTTDPAGAASLRDSPSAAVGMLAGKDRPPADVDLETIVNRATNWLVGMLAVVATFFLTLGGARYLAAGGDPSEVERAKGALKNAGIGYALALLAPTILKILQGILGVQA
jgi:hypothetical protein